MFCVACVFACFACVSCALMKEMKIKEEKHKEGKTHHAKLSADSPAKPLRYNISPQPKDRKFPSSPGEP